MGRFGHGAQLDRAESVWPVHRDRGDEQNRRKWNADDRYPPANEYSHAPKEFKSDRRPRHDMWRRNPQRVKRRGELFGPICDLRVTVREKPITHNQSQRHHGPSSEH